MISSSGYALGCFIDKELLHLLMKIDVNSRRYQVVETTYHHNWSKTLAKFLAGRIIGTKLQYLAGDKSDVIDCIIAATITHHLFDGR